MAWWKKFLVLVVIGGQALMPVTVNAQSAGEIAKEFICMCGCNAVLVNCTHQECSVRDSMLTAIKEKVAQGQSREQIIQSFVAQYGEQVLSSPPKRGFNLTAWITPFVVLLLGGLVIFYVVKKWFLPAK